MKNWGINGTDLEINKFSVDCFLDLYSLDFNPPFQREKVWNIGQKTRFIESILKGVIMPSIIINVPIDTRTGTVIDGKQRLTTIIDFVNDRIDVFSGYKCSEIDNLPKQTVFIQFTRFETMNECTELYLALIYGQTAHTQDEIEKAENYYRKQKDDTSEANVRTSATIDNQTPLY